MVAKFGFLPGIGTYTFSLRTDVPIKSSEEEIYLDLAIFDEAGWTQAFPIYECRKKMSYAVRKERISIRTGSEWSEIKGKIYQNDESKSWFFVIMDCEKATSDIPFKSRTFYYKMVALNSNGSHFSSEETGFVAPTFLFFFSFVMLGVKTFQCQRNLVRVRPFSYQLMMTVGSFYLFSGYLLLRLIHLSRYSFNGKGFPFMDGLAWIALILGEYLLMLLLTMVGWGWTITFQESEDFDFALSFAFLLGVTKTTMIILGRLSRKEGLRAHEYDSWWGWALVGIRVAIFLFFCCGVKRTLGKKKVRIDQNKRIFLQNIFAMGTGYFLGLPAVVLLAMGQKTENAHFLVEFGNILTALMGQIGIFYLFNSKKGGYILVSLSRLALPS